jgi:hypothetical protein
MSALVICVSIYPGVYIFSYSSTLPVKLICFIHYSIRLSGSELLIRLASWLLYSGVERAYVDGYCCIRSGVWWLMSLV